VSRAIDGSGVRITASMTGCAHDCGKAGTSPFSIQAWTQAMGLTSHDAMGACNSVVEQLSAELRALKKSYAIVVAGCHLPACKQLMRAMRLRIAISGWTLFCIAHSPVSHEETGDHASRHVTPVSTSILKVRTMRHGTMRLALAITLLGSRAAAQTASVDGRLPQPRSVTIDRSLSDRRAAAMVRAARLFYAFWDTGDASLVREAVSQRFSDNTLPKGRPQGITGLEFASRGFRAALPDLRCSVEDLLVVGDKITARLAFTGTHTGTFMGKPATGRPVKFLAIDVLRVENGKIVEDWHLEDNLTLMQQLGVVPEL
jgi:predicted ester cyclase